VAVLRNVCFEEGNSLVHLLLLHPVLLELKPLDLSLAPLDLQVVVALYHEVDAFLQLFELLGIPFLVFSQFALHLRQPVGEEGDLLVFVLD
jgi:hypothetical protein